MAAARATRSPTRWWRRSGAPGGEAVADYHDVATHAGAEAAVATTIDAYGKVDIVVNNAGILRDRTMAKVTADDFDAVVAGHLGSSAYVTRAAWPTMREQEYGRVVFTTSAAGLYGNFGQANYCGGQDGAGRPDEHAGARGGVEGHQGQHDRPGGRHPHDRAAHARRSAGGHGGRLRHPGGGLVLRRGVHVERQRGGGRGRPLRPGPGHGGRRLHVPRPRRGHARRHRRATGRRSATSARAQPYADANAAVGKVFGAHQAVRA